MTDMTKFIDIADLPYEEFCEVLGHHFDAAEIDAASCGVLPTPQPGEDQYKANHRCCSMLPPRVDRSRRRIPRSVNGTA